MDRIGGDALVTTILAFLCGIGIETVEGELVKPFLPGVEVRRGRLHFDRARLTWPGDLLHEAGHIAVVPSALRSALDGDLGAAAPPHAGEVEATAWAYAAICALGLDPAVLFHEGGYRGHSAGLITTYSVGVYPGAAGLAGAGMTHLRREHGQPYPAMLRWLRA